MKVGFWWLTSPEDNQEIVELTLQDLSLAFDDAVYIFGQVEGVYYGYTTGELAYILSDEPVDLSAYFSQFTPTLYKP